MCFKSIYIVNETHEFFKAKKYCRSFFYKVDKVFPYETVSNRSTQQDVTNHEDPAFLCHAKIERTWNARLQEEGLRPCFLCYGSVGAVTNITDFSEIQECRLNDLGFWQHRSYNFVFDFRIQETQATHQ